MIARFRKIFTVLLALLVVISLFMVGCVDPVYDGDDTGDGDGESQSGGGSGEGGDTALTPTTPNGGGSGEGGDTAPTPTPPNGGGSGEGGDHELPFVPVE